MSVNEKTASQASHAAMNMIYGDIPYPNIYRQSSSAFKDPIPEWAGLKMSAGATQIKKYGLLCFCS